MSLRFTREQFPDWKDGETCIVTYDMNEWHWLEARNDAISKYGRVHEDVTTQAESERLGRAFFRVPKRKRNVESG